MVDMTASELFSSVVLEVIGPALRTERFKGSGATLVLTLVRSPN
jgi:hypothetical protein